MERQIGVPAMAEQDLNVNPSGDEELAMQVVLLFE